MDKLPSKSLSKSILIATPLFCIVLALMDAADDLSYLFVLEFLGSVDIMFVPTTQPQVRSPNFARDYALQTHGVVLEQPAMGLESSPVPLVQMDIVRGWAERHGNVRGVSPRWIVPVELPKTDALLLVGNFTHEQQLGVGLKSNLQPLGKKDVALSRELLNRLELSVGDKVKNGLFQVDIKLSLPGLLRGGKLVEKYQSFESREEYVVDSPELDVDRITDLAYKALQSRDKDYNYTLSKEEVRKAVQKIYDTEFTLSYHVKFQYRNKGMHPTTLHNVILMELDGLAEMLTQMITKEVVQSRAAEDSLFELLKQTGLPDTQVFLIKTYYRTMRVSKSYQGQLSTAIRDALTNYPLMAISSFKNRQLVYHPNNGGVGGLLSALQDSPGQFQVVSIYPFYKDLEGIRYFFKSVIQIFSFICAVIYFYIMTLIFQQVYEEKEIQVGIWRTLGAGGVKAKQGQGQGQGQGKEGVKGIVAGLRQSLTLREKMGYGYKMLVKVGFLYYWLVSAAISAFLFWLMKQILYQYLSSLFDCDSPPQDMLYPFLTFLLIFAFTIGLAIMHIRSIYINPLVSTIKPVKRTFDVVKVRVIKMATFGITLEALIIAVMLIYYGVVSYYAIPMSILYNDGWLQTILFNSIFLFMIFGAIILLSVLQSRMECLILEGVFKISPRLHRTKAILLKSIKAKQYKNIKVSIIISVIFAFLLFFASGLKIQAMIVQSFIERQLGAELVLENYEKNTFDKKKVESYLDGVQGIRYSWLSNDLDNKKVQLQFQGIVSNIPVNGIFKIVSSNYLDTTYYEYYYPERYIANAAYPTLPNGVSNGFGAIYSPEGTSVGRYDPSDTIRQYDPHKVNINAHEWSLFNASNLMAPQEQIIELVVTSQLRKKLAASPGDYFKLHVRNADTGVAYVVRCRVMHSFKIGPGLDLYSNVAFMSQSQAQYLYSAVGADPSSIRYQKLFVTGSSTGNLNAVGNKVLSISPQHTQLFQMGLVRESFETIQTYLQGFVALVTVILGSLSVLFLFVYTYGKCKEEAQVFKMLRAIGLSVFDIRLMLFVEILIRIIVSIFNGIVLGIVFSLGLSGQIEEVLMINTPPIKLNTILIIAGLMLALFAMTVTQSTKYLTQRTVLETNKA